MYHPDQELPQDRLRDPVQSLFLQEEVLLVAAVVAEVLSVAVVEEALLEGVAVEAAQPEVGEQEDENKY